MIAVAWRLERARSFFLLGLFPWFVVLVEDENMPKIIVNAFLTLDGVMQAPGGPGEDDSNGFAHGGWSVNYWDEHMGQVMGTAMSSPFDSSTLYGVASQWRRTTPRAIEICAPNFSACASARPARAWPEMPVGKPR